MAEAYEMLAICSSYLMSDLQHESGSQWPPCHTKLKLFHTAPYLFTVEHGLA